MRVYVPLLAFLLVGMVPPVPASGSCSENDCFSEAIALDGRSEPGANFGATMEADEPAPCDMTGSVWFTATPRASGTLSISVAGNWFSSLAAYSGNAVSALTLLACSETSFDPEGTPQDQWYPAGLNVACVADQPIRIQVGGQAGATGSFSVLATGCAFDPTVPEQPLWCHGTQAPCLVPGKEKITMEWYAPFWDGGELASISHFVIERSPGASCWSWFETHATAPYTGQTVTQFVDEGLAPGASYCYRVAAVNAVGVGWWSTMRAATVFPLASPPATVSVVPSDDGELNLTWSASADDLFGKPAVFGYRIYGASDAAGPFTLLAEVPKIAARAFEEGGLGRDATRFYHVTTVNAGGEGVASATKSATTPHIPSAPRQVSVAMAVAVTPVAFRVSWQAPTDAPWLQGYEIWRSLDGANEGVLAGVASASATSFTDGGRSPLVDYHYVVKAYNVAGPSPASNRACLAWPMDTPFAACG